MSLLTLCSMKVHHQRQTLGKGDPANLQSAPDHGALVQESSLSSDSLCDLHTTSQTSGPQNEVTRPTDRGSPFHEEVKRVCFKQADHTAFPSLEATVREMHFNLHVFAKKNKIKLVSFKCCWLGCHGYLLIMKDDCYLFPWKHGGLRNIL